MTTVKPQSDNLRSAVKWISEMRQTKNPPEDRKLLEAACLKFNLTPRDAEYLERHMAGKEE